MNNLKYIFLSILAFGLFSCESYFEEVNNQDPDNPTVVTPNVLLPQIQGRLAYTYGGDFTRYVGIFTQHVTGQQRQFTVYQNYGIAPSDTDNMWSNIYSGTLNSNRRLYELATEQGLNHYAGISRALEAMAMLISTDVWGDMPYSNALDFANNGVYSPTFDSQEDIYSSILNVLDEAIGLLNMDDGGSAPSGDDFIYGGDASSWVKFCNVLKARLNLHLSKRNGSDAYTAVLAALEAGSFEGSADSASFPFGSAATENAPWFQYIEQRDDCEVGVFYKNLLSSKGDPRLATYGADHTSSHPIFTPNQLMPMVTFTEQEFIRAEANLMLNNREEAYEAFLNGVRSSMSEALVSSDEAESYINGANISVGADNLSLEDIITQKYLALYTNPEVFSDWRRTGIPNLSPNSGTEIPRRLPYPISERLANVNTPPAAEDEIYQRVWWDQ